ncbi:unnamed protein product [Rotaria socialis]|uniref:Major facilitator superfamily (MFS) profile domain-containing protein n=1 Tax=Rotaria socialis TaxID=392032 RepID=A0A819V7G4_9BILA|nr:unnamed protein product [Rotaria socialis]CAF3393100.1 unnamed protein product [Rotaria socialis]CAF3727506.1 unnamed protein product [Rotaria socialis]CAF4104677.1 unnamed protein product [Rotaria socialis]CAF4106555.1 unnamed protein product [Rotaria socialis]
MKFDDFYETVGVFGPYQKTKYFLLCLTNLLPPIMVYAWTFIAASPQFNCRPPFDMSSNNVTNELGYSSIPTAAQCRESHKRISLKECQRCFYVANTTNSYGSINELTACQNFTFNRTYYESTLVEHWSMVCDQVSLKSNVQSVFFFGYMVGSLLFGILSDRFGRRPIMGVSFVLMFIAGIICALAPEELIGRGTSYHFFALGRFLLACATRGISITAFVIGSEIVGSKQRLFAGIVIKYFFALGELLLLSFAVTIRTWRTLNAVLAVVPVPFIFFYFILPESPRWLVSEQRYDEAELIFHHIAEKNKTHFDPVLYQRFVREDRKRVAASQEVNHGVKALFRSKVMGIIAVNMSYQWFVQNLVFYGTSQSTDKWSNNPYIGFGTSAFVELFAYFAVHLLLDRWGRKLTYCLFVFALICTTILVVPIQMIVPKDSKYQIYLMFTVNAALKFLASGSYVIIYIYANETFPTKGRNTGMGVCSMIARVGAIMGTYSNDNLTRAWQHFPVVIYGITSLFAMLLATVFPETLDKPLPQTIEDVERMGLACSFTRPKKKKNTHVNGTNDFGDDFLLKKTLTEDVDL